MILSRLRISPDTIRIYEELTREEVLEMIEDYLAKKNLGSLGFEPYSISEIDYGNGLRISFIKEKSKDENQITT